ncbi:Aste57867_13463 [Aphanomyces stellatus]|uniref:Aste57867_13463 protein n=1 Tax=Aphanomyces stellatus TaxID=120398 RepID=A0A485KZV9_9STRA|nr:hypothetical protein As57867_013413 [Aphanomyces stellatus]VFT90301.1 Aste57867_13463 [Aphanomyces stellatus]
MGTVSSRPPEDATKTEENTFAGASVGNDQPEFSLSNAVLLAHKFTERHPLFRWRGEQNIVQEMGNRAAKHMFLVDFSDLSGESKCRIVLSVLPAHASLLVAATAASLNTYKLKSLLVSLRHPFLFPILDVEYAKHPGGLLVVQPLAPAGSLKDLLHRKASPCAPYATKYTMRRSGGGLSRSLVRRYARHVLEALLALRAIGIVCDHVKTSNVLVDAGVARVSDVFNSVLAIDRDPRLDDLTLPLEAVGVPIDQLLFGHFLYELALGRELQAVAPSPADIAAMPLDVADVLRVLFAKPTSSAQPSTTLDTLRTMPLFATSGPANDDLVLPALETHLDASMKSLVRVSMAAKEARRKANIELFVTKEAARAAAAAATDAAEGKPLPRPTNPRQLHRAKSLAATDKPMRRAAYRKQHSSATVVGA